MAGVEEMKLVIVLLTYNRLDYALKTLRSTIENLKFSGEISVHIADDGSSEEYRDTLKFLAGGYTHIKGVSVSNSQRGGYGKNYNLALQTVHLYADYILPLEDDWVLTQELNLDRFIPALDNINIGCLRLGYIGFTQELRGRVHYRDSEHYLIFDSNSPEPHVFAGHPRIETIQWEREVGPWPEGLRPGATEFAVAHLPAARQRVAWPMSIRPSGNYFVHIGAERT